MAEQIGLQAVLDMSQFTGNVSKYLASVQKMEGETASMAGKVTGHFQSFGKLALAATAGIAGAASAAAAGLAKFTIDGIKQAANLEAQLSSIGAVLGATKEQLGPLNDLIMNLGLDPTLVVTAQEAANVIEELAKQGMNMSQIMDGAAKSTILLANATGGDFTDSATVMTDAMSLFGITAADSMQAVNGITGVVNASKYSLNDYALALGAGGAVASQAGISFTDFNTTIAATSSSFTSASDAGTSLKTFIQRLTPQSKEARGAIEELGLSFYNADGTMKSMAEIGSELNRVFQEEVTTTQQVSGLTQEQANRKKYLEQTIQSLNTKLADYQSGLAGVAQSEADKAVSVDRLNRQLVAAQNEYATLTGVQGGVVTSTRKLTDEEKTYYMGLIFGTDAMRMAYAMMETGEIAYTDAAVAARELGVSIDEVNKVAEGGITKFEAFQLQIAKVDAQEQAKQRMDNLKGALQILGGQFETIQLMIGQKFLPILTDMARWFSEFVSQHSPAVIAAFSAFADNLSALINYVRIVVTDGDTMNDWLTHMSPTLQSVVLGVVGFVGAAQQAIDTIAAFLSPIATAISSFVSWQDVLIVVGAAIASVVIPAIAGMIAAIAPVIAVVGAAILTVAALRTAWEADFLGIKTATAAVVGYLTTAFQPFTSAVSQHMSGALAEIKAFATGNQTEFTNVKAIWDGAKTSGMTLFNDLKTYVTSNLPTWIATLSQWGNAATEWIVNAAGVIASKVTAWYSSLSAAINSKYGGWSGLFTTWATAAWQWIVNAASVIGAKVAAWYGNLSAAISSRAAGWTNLFTQWAVSAWNWIITASGLVGAKIAAWYAILAAAVSSKLATWTNLFTQWTIAAWQWIQAAIPSAMTQLNAWYTNLAGSINAKLATWKSVLTQWTLAAWQWIQLAIPQATAQLNTLVTNLLGSLNAKLPTWKSALTQWTLAAWQWIQQAIPQATSQINTLTANLLSALSQKLPTWKSALLNWANAAWQWIQPAAKTAVTELAAWAKQLLGALDKYLPQLVSTMLQWAAALVTWVSDKTADVLPHLGTWFGRITAWVVLSAAALTVEAAKFAVALIGWVATDLIPQTGPALAQFGAAILAGMATVASGLYGFASNMATEFWKTIYNAANWSDLGNQIISAVKSGVESMASSLYSSARNLANNSYQQFTSINWGAAGKAIITGIIKGLSDTAGELWSKMKALAKKAFDEFMEGLFASSPSRLFMKSGEAIVTGVIAGIENNEGELVNTISGLASTIDKTFRGAIKPVVEGFGNLMSQSLADLKDALNSFGGMFGTISKYTNDLFSEEGNKAIKDRMDAQQDLLSVQAELLDMVEKLGINPQTAVPFILGLDVNKGDLQNQIKKIWDILLVESEKALQQRQKDMGVKFAIQEITKLLATQDQAFASLAEFEFTTVRAAAQVEPLAKRWDEINQLITSALSTETDASKLNATLNGLYSERATIMQQLNALQSDQLAGIDKYTKGAELAAIQLELITKAMEIGAAIPEAAFGDILTDPATLEAIKHLERVASADALGQLQKSISDLQLKPVYDAIAAQDALIEKMSGGEYSYATKSLIDTLVQNYHSFDNYIKSISESNADVAYKEAMINGYLEHRATILDQIRTTIERTPNTANSDVIAMQLELIREAQALNIAIPAEAWNSTSVNFLYAVQSLESAIATAKEANLQKELNNLFSLQGTPFDSMNVDKQMALIQQAKEAGAWIAPAAFGNLADPQTIMALADLYQRTLSQQAVNAQNQLAQMMVQQMTQVTEAQNAAFAQLEANQAKTLAGAGAMQTISTAWENLTVQINAVVNEMAQLSVAQLNSAQGIDLQQQLNNLLAQRAILYQQLADAQRLEVDYGVAESKQRTEFVQKQMAIMQEAKDLGVALPDAIFGAMNDPATLAALSAVEGAIARTKAAAEQAKLDASRLFKDLPFNSMDVQQQIQLIQKAIDMGIQVPKSAFGSLADPITMQSLAGLYNQIQVVNQEVFGQTLKALEAQYQASSLLGDLYDADIQATGIGSGLINTYKTQMLDPMMKAINDASTTEAERLRLIEEYKANMEQIVRLQKAQSQLDFLKIQQDIISQLDSGSGHLSNMDLQGIINEIRANIDSGFQFGSGASWEGLLHFASRGTELLLKTFAAKMGINSPSTVMMDYGRYVVEGFAIGMKDLTERPLAVMEEMLVPIREKLSGFVNGINSLAVQPVSASPRLMPLPASMSPSVMTMNMGGVTINNGMDEAMFAARVRQVVEGMLN